FLQQFFLEGFFVLFLRDRRRGEREAQQKRADRLHNLASDVLLCIYVAPGDYARGFRPVTVVRRPKRALTASTRGVTPRSVWTTTSALTALIWADISGVEAMCAA